MASASLLTDFSAAIVFCVTAACCCSAARLASNSSDFSRASPPRSLWRRGRSPARSAGRARSWALLSCAVSRVALCRRSVFVLRSSDSRSASCIDLLLQFVQRLVAPGQCRRQIELPGGEHQQNKDDHHQQLRQGVDKAGPDVDAGAARISRGDGHGSSGPCAQRRPSSASAAMVRARMRISPRSSCTLCARPCDKILGQPRGVGLDVAQMVAQHVVLPDRTLGDRRRAGPAPASAPAGSRRAAPSASARPSSARRGCRDGRSGSARVELAPIRLSSPRARMRCRFSRLSAVCSSRAWI